MQSRLKEAAKQGLIPYQAVAREKIGSLSSTRSLVPPVQGGFFRATVHSFKSLPTSSTVALLTPLETTSLEETKKTTLALETMRERGIPATCVNYEFFHEPKTGLRLAPFANLGSLRDYLRENARKLSVDIAQEIIRQLFNGVYALHSRLLVHRDLKPENWLLFFDKGKLLSKLADPQHVVPVDRWGRIKEAGDVEMTGTAGFLAPELVALKAVAETKEIRQESTEARKSNINYFKIDSFAFGKTCQEILAEVKAREQASINPALKIAIQGFIQTNPADRVAITDVAGKGFFKYIETRFLSAKVEDEPIPSVTSMVRIMEEGLQPLVKKLEEADNLGSKIENFYHKLEPALLYASDATYSSIINEYSNLQRATCDFILECGALGKNYVLFKDILNVFRRHADDDWNDLRERMKDDSVQAVLVYKAILQAHQEVPEKSVRGFDFGMFPKSRRIESKDVFLKEVSACADHSGLPDYAALLQLLVDREKRMNKGAAEKFAVITQGALENALKSHAAGFNTASKIIPAKKMAGTSLSQR